VCATGGSADADGAARCCRSAGDAAADPGAGVARAAAAFAKSWSMAAMPWCVPADGVPFLAIAGVPSGSEVALAELGDLPGGRRPVSYLNSSG
jgi:hypothetical protein